MYIYLVYGTEPELPVFRMLDTPSVVEQHLFRDKWMKTGLKWEDVMKNINSGKDTDLNRISEKIAESLIGKDEYS